MTKHRVSRRILGFTLVELMIVVVILGILAAVALPAMTRYVKRSRTSEVTENLAAMYSAESLYYSRASETNSLSVAQFISCTATPSAVPRAQRINGIWSSGGWEVIGFTSDKPLYYQYQIAAMGLATSATVTMTAAGDLDGNGTTSLFSRSASIIGAEVVGSVTSTINELE